jgi:hypothetical protein
MSQLQSHDFHGLTPLALISAANNHGERQENPKIAEPRLLLQA